jgi:two-component system cell cycle sensor histidine kinase/response regulator CckA
LLLSLGTQPATDEHRAKRIVSKASDRKVRSHLPGINASTGHFVLTWALLESQTMIHNFAERQRAKALRAGQNGILEMIARGAPLEDVLEKLMRLNESQCKGMLCSVLLLDPNGKHLRHGAAPSLPEVYTKAIDGCAIGPNAGSCGTAAYRKEQVIVTDIRSDPLWAAYRHLAAPHGLRACWSTPIFSRQAKVLGTFAMYYREVRAPTRTEIQLIESTTHLAGIGIERQLLEERLRQAQKMEALGQLAGGIAHDFNNILTVIKGNASLLRTGQLSRTEQACAAAEIAAAADRAASLTRHLLTFGRRQLMEPQNLDLNAVVANVASMLQRLIGEHIALETRYARGGAPVHVDPGMMEQVLVNFAVNSRDAMPKGGRIVLQTARVENEAEGRSRRPGEYVRLSVGDTGTGIAAEHLPHIFEPFFTTKELGKGTGLGLATVFSIVEQHRGWIEVESEVNVGTTFHLYLPRSAKIRESTARPAKTPNIRGGTETILLVEDEEAVRQLMRNVLEHHGYRTLAAVSGVAALEIWRQYRAAIDLVVTDMVMPGGIGGRALAEQMRSEKPELKVIYCSGYTDDVLGNDSPLRMHADFCEKPFQLDKFLGKVRDCLDAKN